MAAVRIEVGASVNSSLGQVFRPVTDASARARRQVESDARAAVRAQEREYVRLQKMRERAAAQGAAAEMKAHQATVRSAERAAAMEMRAKQRQIAQEQRYFAERVRASARARAAEERDARATSRVVERAGRRAARQSYRDGRSSRQFLANTGRDAFHNVGAAAGMAAGVAGTVARGFGVNLDPSSHMQAAGRLETRVVDLINSGYMPGQMGPNGTVRSQGEVTGKIKGVADRYGFSRESAAAGLQAFTGKSGNLDLGLKSIDAMARLAKATGTELNDMLSAAGELAPQLQNSVDPAGDLLQVMRDMAGQGKAGAIEIKDLASVFASITASGAQFEGDIANNMKSLGMMAQLARAYGGARSAAEAMTGISGFTTTLKKNARREAFASEGISLEGAGGLMRDPIEIMKDAVFKTGGDVGRINKMFMDVRGAKPVEGLANIYRQAGGGSAGEAAVNAKLAELAAATMTAADESDALGRALSTTETKAQKFNNRMDDVAERFAQNVLPSMEKVAPAFEKLVTTFAGAVEWSAENPGMAITAAIVASIAKAAIGQAVASALTAFIAGGGAAAAAGGGGAAAAGAAGAAGLAAKGGILGTIAGGVAIAGASIATGGYLRSLYEDYKGAEDVENEWALSRTGGVRDGKAIKTRRNAETGALENYEAAGAQTAWGGIRGAAASAMKSLGDAQGGKGGEALAAAAAKLSGTNEALANALTGTINVNIVGGLPGAAPGPIPGRGGSPPITGDTR